VLMRPTTTYSYDPPNFIKSIYIINYWVMDGDTPLLSPSKAIDVNSLKPNNIEVLKLKTNSTI
jgi:hypothetical protein